MIKGQVIYKRITPHKSCMALQCVGLDGPRHVQIAIGKQKRYIAVTQRTSENNGQYFNISQHTRNMSAPAFRLYQ